MALKRKKNAEALTAKGILCMTKRSNSETSKVCFRDLRTDMVIKGL